MLPISFPRSPNGIGAEVLPPASARIAPVISVIGLAILKKLNAIAPIAMRRASPPTIKASVRV
jgi:hypothetical protein